MLDTAQKNVKSDVWVKVEKNTGFIAWASRQWCHIKLKLFCVMTALLPFVEKNELVARNVLRGKRESKRSMKSLQTLHYWLKLRDFR